MSSDTVEEIFLFRLGHGCKVELINAWRRPFLAFIFHKSKGNCSYRGGIQSAGNQDPATATYLLIIVESTSIVSGVMDSMVNSADVTLKVVRRFA